MNKTEPDESKRIYSIVSRPNSKHRGSHLLGGRSSSMIARRCQLACAAAVPSRCDAACCFEACWPTCCRRGWAGPSRAGHPVRRSVVAGAAVIAVGIKRLTIDLRQRPPLLRHWPPA